MGYSVKWVEDNLGVTRKALRGFENAGLMPPNIGGRYRDYSDEDIDRIWTIRVLQGIGYKIKEIVSMVNDDNFDFDDSIAQKVKELEAEKEKIELNLGYAKKIKLTGRCPDRPKNMGIMKFEEFQKDALKEWNIVGDPQGKEYARFAETILSKPIEEWENSDLGCFLSTLENMLSIGTDVLLVECVLPKEIVKRKYLGYNHPDVQFLIKLIYENQKSLGSMYGIEEDLTPEQFSRFYSSSYISGDIAKMKMQELSKEDCEFIAEAVSLFGRNNNCDKTTDE